jgi:hypothetical protein
MAKPRVAIALNPHWYSQFWIKQFWQLRQRGEISLRPLLRKKNPYASFYFEVDGQPCLIDVHDKKELQFDPAEFAVYFKANFSSYLTYPENVVPCWNGTTLKRDNIPPEGEKEFDIVFISSITGGRHHKVALYEALSRLPLKSKLVLKLLTPDDEAAWGKLLREAGVETVTDTWPYREWLAWQKRGRWCVLTRGKHDCLSFKMLDYMSIGAAVAADYSPTSRWPVTLAAGTHFLNLDVPPFPGDEMDNPDMDSLRSIYAEKAAAALPALRDEALRQKIGAANYAYFGEHIARGAAAEWVLSQVAVQLPLRERPVR